MADLDRRHEQRSEATIHETQRRWCRLVSSASHDDGRRASLERRSGGALRDGGEDLARQLGRCSGVPLAADDGDDASVERREPAK